MPGSVRALVRGVLRELDADYVIGLGPSLPRRRLAPLPGQGPVLTWRRVATARVEPPRDWGMGLGDIELF